MLYDIIFPLNLQGIQKILKVRFIGHILLYPVSITNVKEDPNMKALVMKYLAYTPYPGAATRREQMHKFLDKCLLAASAIGIVAALMFLAVLV